MNRPRRGRLADCWGSNRGLDWRRRCDAGQEILALTDLLQLGFELPAMVPLNLKLDF
jgi:hypothetical protein